MSIPGGIKMDKCDAIYHRVDRSDQNLIKQLKLDEVKDENHHLFTSALAKETLEIRLNQVKSFNRSQTGRPSHSSAGDSSMYHTFKIGEELFQFQERQMKEYAEASMLANPCRIRMNSDGSVEVFQLMNDQSEQLQIVQDTYFNHVYAGHFLLLSENIRFFVDSEEFNIPLFNYIRCAVLGCNAHIIFGIVRGQLKYRFIAHSSTCAHSHSSAPSPAHGLTLKPKLTPRQIAQNRSRDASKKFARGDGFDAKDMTNDRFSEAAVFHSTRTKWLIKMNSDNKGFYFHNPVPKKSVPGLVRYSCGGTAGTGCNAVAFTKRIGKKLMAVHSTEHCHPAEDTKTMMKFIVRNAGMSYINEHEHDCCFYFV